ncbi:RIIa domain-containing protein 1 [Xenopus laevis]|uniref:RIIa domain-containing protein 1 n=1 Tax=Xenopus laevis TaxID=8355 RepID=A0A8J1LK92_XENLA|nr:RIIa domain-containing protein 1 [Xenopus laevis]
MTRFHRNSSGGFHGNEGEWRLCNTEENGGAGPGGLNEEQRQRVEEFKIQTRVSNETFLREHQEMQLLISGFLGEVLLRRPENIRESLQEVRSKKDTRPSSSTLIYNLPVS